MTLVAGLWITLGSQDGKLGCLVGESQMNNSLRPNLCMSGIQPTSIQLHSSISTVGPELDLCDYVHLAGEVCG